MEKANDKSLADNLDEKLFSEKIFKKFYLILSFWLILSPMVELLFWTFGVKFLILTQSLFISVLFCIAKVMETVFNFRNWHFKKNVTTLLVFCFFVWFLISSFVVGAINFHFFIAITYFLTFVIFLNVEKKYYKTISFVFAIEMIFDTILGIIDLHNKFIPGFDSEDFAMSLQFGNPNWSGFVMMIAGVAILWFMINSKTKWQKGLWLAGLTVLLLGLFIGGSYVPEFSFILCELAILIYYWIKNKKCPIWILSAFLLTIFISFFVWFIPAFRDVSTAYGNFFYESLAIIDRKLNTNFVRDVSTLVDKIFHTGTISGVRGSDGWDRNDYIAMAFSAIFTNAKTFIFGYGAGYLHSHIRVHNCYVGIWLEFGVVGFILYNLNLVSLLVRFIRVKKSEKTVVLFSCVLMMLFEKLFCCIEPYCYGFFVMLVAVLFRELYSSPLKTDLKNNDNVKKSEINDDVKITKDAELKLNEKTHTEFKN